METETEIKPEEQLKAKNRTVIDRYIKELDMQPFEDKSHII